MPGEHQGGDEATLRFARLLAARLCHDLGGVLAGLVAALGEVPDDPQALPLAVDAAGALARRVALLRTAWGEDPAPLDCARLGALAGGLPNAGRLRIVCRLQPPDADLPAATVRLLANVMLLAAESLPRGGTLEMTGEAGGRVLVQIDGARAGWPPGLGALLASPPAARLALEALHGAAGVRGLQSPLTAVLAHQGNIAASLLLSATAGQPPPLLLDFTKAAENSQAF